MATFANQPVTNNTLRTITNVEIVSKPRANHAVGGAVTVKYGVGQNIVVAVTWDDDVSWALGAQTNAGIRVQLMVGTKKRNAELVTDGATSGTARTLWFSYTVVAGDTDSDGVEVLSTSNKLVRTRSGATLKDADDSSRNAGLNHAALGTQSAHKVEGSVTPTGNGAPTFDDGDESSMGTNFADASAPPGILVNQSLGDGSSHFSDPNGDTLRFKVSAALPSALSELFLHPRGSSTPSRYFLRASSSCVLEDLELETTVVDGATLFEQVITVTATDPDGASVDVTGRHHTGWDCNELVSAAVDGDTLTLTYDSQIATPAHVPAKTQWEKGLDGSQFTVNVDGARVNLAATMPTKPVQVSGKTITLKLAAAVTPDSVVTVSYEPKELELGDTPVRGLTDQTVTNTTLTPHSASVTGDELTLTFNSNLAPLAFTGADGADPAREIRYAFGVAGLYWNGVPIISASPERVTVNGKTVTLKLTSSLMPGSQVAVRYIASTAEALEITFEDTDGNKVPSFSRQMTVTPTTPPLLVSGEVAGTALTLVFDKELDSGSAPVGSRFTVSAHPPGYFDPNRSIAGTGTATVSGKRVTVTLDRAVADHENASVRYRPGDDANPLRGSSNGPEVGRILGAVLGVGDRTSPMLGEAVVAGTKLILYYDEKLDTSSRPSTSAFAVLVDGNTRGVSSVSMSEDAVTLTLASSAGTDAVTVTYTVPSENPIQDLAGNEAVALSTSQSVDDVGATNSNKPELATTDPAVADDVVVTLTFDQKLDPATVPSTSAFSLSPSYLRVTDVAVRGSELVLSIGSGIYPCTDNITVSYTKPGSNALRNVWGTQADAFTDQAATNANAGDCTTSGVQGQAGGPSGTSEPGGANARRSMSLRFDRALNRLRTPSPEGFSVASTTPGGAAAAPVEISDVEFPPDPAHLQMELSRDLAPGERLTVSYRQPRTGPGLWDVNGNQIAPFAARIAVPGGAPTVTGVEVVSDAGDDGTYAMGEVISLRVTFSEAVAVTGTPLLGIDMDPAHWGRKEAVYASGSGTAELIFTHTVVEPNYSTQGIAVLAGTLSLDGGTIRSVSSQADAELAHTGLGHDPEHKVDWRQLPPDANGNRPLVYRGASQTLYGAEPGYLVSLEVSADDFVNPDGGTLAFSLSASRDDIYVPGGLSYNETIGRVFLQVKTACALVGLAPPESDAYYTVVTVTATNPDGATAHATATFRTDASRSVCPSLSSAAVDGATLTITLDDDAASSFERATGDEFAVKVDGAAVSLAGAGTDAVAVSGTTIVLTLASPVSAGQTVTVSYTPGDNPIAAVFTDQSVTNNTPATGEPAATGAPAATGEPAASDDPPGADDPPADDPEADDPTQDDPASEPSVLIGAAVSGKELTLTFSQDLAAMDAATAGSLRWSFLVDGAFYLGAAVRNQSPARVVIDGATVTLTLGTAILPGVEATVRYFAGASGNGLQFADGTAIADFATTLTTTQRN